MEKKKKKKKEEERNILSRMKKHPDKANQRDGVLQNLVFPVNPSLLFSTVFFLLVGIAGVSMGVTVFVQNSSEVVVALGNEGLPEQVIAVRRSSSSSCFEGRETRV